MRHTPRLPRRSLAPLFLFSALAIGGGGSAIFFVMRDRAVPPPKLSVIPVILASSVPEIDAASPAPPEPDASVVASIDASTDARAPSPPSKRFATNGQRVSYSGRCNGISVFDDALPALSACVPYGRCPPNTSMEISFDEHSAMMPSKPWDGIHIYECESVARMVTCVRAIRSETWPRGEAGGPCTLTLRMQ